MSNYTQEPRNFSAMDSCYASSHKRTYDSKKDLYVTNIFSGEYYVTEGPKEMICTILGSCVAVCVHDPIAKVSGMNHFLLPGNEEAPFSPKYGIFAMEYMINEVLKRGGLKKRLIVKIFGGAKIHNQTYSLNIGERNIAFIREYLANEGLNIIASDIGGTHPRKIYFMGDTGKVMVNKIRQLAVVNKVVEEEDLFAKSIKQSPYKGSIELFKE